MKNIIDNILKGYNENNNAIDTKQLQKMFRTLYSDFNSAYTSTGRDPGISQSTADAYSYLKNQSESTNNDKTSDYKSTETNPSTFSTVDSVTNTNEFNNTTNTSTNINNKTIPSDTPQKVDLKNLNDSIGLGSSLNQIQNTKNNSQLNFNDYKNTNNNIEGASTSTINQNNNTSSSNKTLNNNINKSDNNTQVTNKSEDVKNNTSTINSIEKNNFTETNKENNNLNNNSIQKIDTPKEQYSIESVRSNFDNNLKFDNIKIKNDSASVGTISNDAKNIDAELNNNTQPNDVKINNKISEPVRTSGQKNSDFKINPSTTINKISQNYAYENKSPSSITSNNTLQNNSNIQPVNDKTIKNEVSLRGNTIVASDETTKNPTDLPGILTSDATSDNWMGSKKDIESDSASVAAEPDNQYLNTAAQAVQEKDTQGVNATIQSANTVANTVKSEMSKMPSVMAGAMQSSGSGAGTSGAGSNIGSQGNVPRLGDLGQGKFVPQKNEVKAGMSDDYGGIRDPAYALRIRAWERIRGEIAYITTT